MSAEPAYLRALPPLELLDAEAPEDLGDADDVVTFRAERIPNPPDVDLFDGLEPVIATAPRTWTAWQTWDAVNDRSGPLHGPRRDRPDGGKDIPWPRGARPRELLYFATPDHRPPPAGSTIVLTEGEKAADAVAEAGYLAAATVCGASSDPVDAVVQLLASFRVVLAPDNDEPGRRHMAPISDRLERAGAPALYLVPAPAGAPVGWDLADAELGERRRILEDAIAQHVVSVATEPIAAPTGDWQLDDLDAKAGAPTWRTLADVDDAPPGPLLFGMLEPQGPTLAYAAPGVGKGTTGAWLVCQALELGMRPVVFDAERRPREWARRVSGLGGDRSRVVYLEPQDLGPDLAGRPFWDQAAAVRAIVDAAGGDLFILDSLLPAAGVGEDRLRSDAQAPFLFVSALDSLERPSLSFGHPPKGQPEGDPFGSMAWLAAFRMTWLGTTAEGDGHRVRWRPRKRNERGYVPGVLLAVTYGDDGRPSGVDRSDDDESSREWILAALVHGPRRATELVEELLEEIAEPQPGEPERVRERIGRMLRRMAHEGWVERVGPAGGRTVTWALRVRDGRP